MAQEFQTSTHPPLPPTTEDEMLSWLRLLRSRRVGVSTFHRLLGEHGSASAALSALPEVAREAGMDGYHAFPEDRAIAELRAGHRAGARLVAQGSSDYPAHLSEISDAPPLLWIRGNAAALARPLVAIVGARNASSLGVRMARKLAGDLADAGFTIVSGLARGIDTAAHQASAAKGTIAVMAGGVDVIYPAENAALATEIEGAGLRLSEQPIGLQPQARHFPRRNRLVSGLAAGLVVIEAAAKSGSLITARCALDQGREVLAVPGHPFDARASGCNMLIRDGARLVRSAADVIEALGAPEGLSPEVAAQAEMALAAPIPAPPPEKRTWREMAQLHKAILDRLGPSPLAEDQLIRDLATPANSVAPALLDLELEGKIARQSGGLLSLATTANKAS